MSTYTYRFIEYYAECIDGSVWKKESLPSAEDNIGRVFRINIYQLPEGHHRYYKSVLDASGNPVWEGLDEVEKKWHHLKWYSPCGVRQFSPGEEEMKKYHEQHTFKAVGPDGKEMLMFENTHWCNNGGHVRDDYISTHGWGESKLCGRGLPADVSDTVREEVDGSEYHYDKTYVSFSEWEAELDRAIERFKDRIKSEVKDQRLKDLNDKVDELLAIAKGKKYSKKSKYDEDEYDAFEEIFQEDLWTILNISDEIQICDDLIDEFTPPYVQIKDRRIIYFLA